MSVSLGTQEFNMRVPAVKKRRGAGHAMSDGFTGKSNSLTKAFNHQKQGQRNHEAK